MKVEVREVPKPSREYVLTLTEEAEDLLSTFGNYGEKLQTMFEQRDMLGLAERVSRIYVKLYKTLKAAGVTLHYD